MGLLGEEKIVGVAIVVGPLECIGTEEVALVLVLVLDPMVLVTPI